MADRQKIRTAYRQLGVVLHPDKAGIEAVEQWIRVKTAYEVLSDPVLRFAYDRFGPKVGHWRQPGGDMSMVDVVIRGITDCIMEFYGASLATLVVLQIFGIGLIGQSWRYILLIAAFLIEVTLATRSLETINLIPLVRLLPFQEVAFLRKVLVALFVGISQVGALFQPPPINSQTMITTLDRMENTMRELAQETSSLLAVECMPFPGQYEAIKRELKERIVEGKVLADPNVQDALQRRMAEKKAR
jgi:hypothetical protein